MLVDSGFVWVQIPPQASNLTKRNNDYDTQSFQHVDEKERNLQTNEEKENQDVRLWTNSL